MKILGKIICLIGVLCTPLPLVPVFLIGFGAIYISTFFKGPAFYILSGAGILSIGFGMAYVQEPKIWPAFVIGLGVLIAIGGKQNRV